MDTVLKTKRTFTYRLQEPKSNLKTFEIGIIEEPSEYRKQYPDSWCDARICEGFWGDEELVKKIVDILNSNFSF